MAYQTQMLLRTSLEDKGDMSGHGSYCSSPDMITHAMVENPQTTFSADYDKDPNERIDQSSMVNPVYTRVKSMQKTPGIVNGYIRMYRAGVSLFMNTDQWKNNKLRTPRGKDTVKVMTSKNGDISVGDDIFVVDGTKPNFCMVGIVNTTSEETLPQNFRSYNDFVMWVHGNRSVAVRNFTIVRSGVSNDYDSLYYLSNPESKSRLGSILVEAKNLPKGTLFGIKNEALGIDKSVTFDPNDPTKAQVADSAFLSPGFSGYVEVYARLPKNTVWPAEASLQISFWISAEQVEPMLKFALPAHKLLLASDAARFYAENKDPGRLVRVGFCETKFVTEASG